MTDRLKTVYPPKTTFCGGIKKSLGPELNRLITPVVFKTEIAIHYQVSVGEEVSLSLT